MANERDSKFDVVHRCFPEGGNSIVCVFFKEPLRAKLHDNTGVSLAS